MLKFQAFPESTLAGQAALPCSRALLPACAWPRLLASGGRLAGRTSMPGTPGILDFLDFPDFYLEFVTRIVLDFPAFYFDFLLDFY